MSEQNNSETKPVHIPTVAIVGRPNVGKSSLFNAIVGRRLSIVHEMPGVTRDRVVAPLVRGKCRFQLIDTGGLGMLSGETRKVDMWDSRIASQVDIAIGGADVLILVANVQDGVVNLDEEVAARLRESGKPVLFAANKCDNPTLEHESVEFMKLGFRKIFPVSCLHKRGVNALVEAAIKLLPQNVSEDGESEAPAVKPLNIAVVGRPNVGKSSLVNALLGEERVMVSDVAGTTRDAIDVDFTLRYQGGRPRRRAGGHRRVAQEGQGRYRGRIFQRDARAGRDRPGGFGAFRGGGQPRRDDRAGPPYCEHDSESGQGVRGGRE